MTAASTLEARDVALGLGGRPVLADASVALRPGWTAVVGPNGAGKSTLLRILAGLQRATSGSVALDGRPLSQITPRDRARHIAWMAQQPPADTDLRVLDIVRLGRLPHVGLHGAFTPLDDAGVQQAMRDTACDAWQLRPLRTLSGGERQRALLARALAVDAPVLLLDEPTTHLDPLHQVAVARLLRRLADAGRVVVCVVHDVTLALQADRLVVMTAGRVVGDGATGDPAVHAAVVQAFEGALDIARIGDRWQAAPRFGLPGAVERIGVAEARRVVA